MNRSKPYTLGLALAVGISVWGGYQLAIARTGGGVSREGPPAQAGAHGEDRAVSRKTGTRLPSRELIVGAIRNGFDLPRDASVCWERISEFTESQVKEALEWQKQNRGPGSDDISSMLYFRWGQIDPLSALAAVPASSEEPKRDVVMAWMKRDPAAAFAWGQKNGSEREKFFYSGMMASVLAADESEAAIATASAYGQRILRGVLEQKSRAALETAEDRSAFLARLAASGDDAALTVGRESLMQTWAYKDPEAALAGIDALGFSDEGKQAASREALVEWGVHHPAEAMKWLDRHPDPQHEAAVVSVYSSWAQQSAGDAGRWLDEQPRIASLTGRVVEQMSVKANLSNPATLELMRSHLDRWRTLDPAGADQWLAKASPVVAEKLKQTK